MALAANEIKLLNEVIMLISEILGRQSVQIVPKRPRRSRQESEELRKEVIRQMDAGISPRVVAKALGVSIPYVYVVRKRERTKPSPGGDAA